MAKRSPFLGVIDSDNRKDFIHRVQRDLNSLFLAVGKKIVLHTRFSTQKMKGVVGVVVAVADSDSCTRTTGKCSLLRIQGYPKTSKREIRYVFLAVGEMTFKKN